MHIAIVGAATGVGHALIRALDKNDTVDQILAIDTEPPRRISTKLEFQECSCGEDWAEALSGRRVDFVLWLPGVPSGHVTTAEPLANVERDCANFVQACSVTRVSGVIVASGHGIYGQPSGVGEDRLRTEGDPMASETHAFGPGDLVRERYLAEFARTHPECIVSVFRLACVVGAEVYGHGDRLLRNPDLFDLADPKACFQFVHASDVAEAMARMIKLGRSGIYNLACEGALSLPELGRLVGDRAARPFSKLRRFRARVGQAMRPGTGKSRRLQTLRSTGNACILDNTKSRRDLGLELQYTNTGAALDHLRAVPESGMAHLDNRSA